MSLSPRAQAVLNLLTERQSTDRPFLLGSPSIGKSEAAAAWRELVAAGLVTETEVVKGVARYEMPGQPASDGVDINRTDYREGNNLTTTQ